MNISKKILFLLYLTLSASSVINASVHDTQAMIDGVRYKTDYFAYYLTPYYEFREYQVGYNADLKTTNSTQQSTVRLRLQAEKIDNNLLFYDGSKLPIINYGAYLIKSNYPGIRYVPEGYTVTDTLAMRYPYYKGDVWIQDSVYMRTPPNLRKSKYLVVVGLGTSSNSNDQFTLNEVGTFNEELRSIRTPKYAVVYKDVFKDCTGLHTAQIGASQAVETGAFEGCTALETVFFESAPYVQNDAFKNCPNIKYVVMNTKCPKAPEGSQLADLDLDYDRSPFDSQIYEKATLYVREDQMEAFRNDATWGKFLNIRNIEEYIAGIEPVVTDERTVEYKIYDLSGVLKRTTTSASDWSSELPAGIYIVKSSTGSVRKIHVK